MIDRAEAQPSQNIDWAVYKPEQFTPTGKQYETIEVSESLSLDVAVALQGMIAVFRGETPPTAYWQLPRMGRACFTPVNPENTNVISPKGSLGRSAGSESIRQLQESRVRALFRGAAGCVSLPVTDEVNFLVTYKINADQQPSGPIYEIEHAAPEGYSRFSLLLREYRAFRELLEPVDVPAPKALALLRRDVALPWLTVGEAKQHLNALFMQQYNTQPHDGSHYAPYDNLNSGLLFRLFEGAVRPQDHYDRALKGEWDELHLAMKASISTPDEVLSRLAIAAGKLAEHGIVHGQLFYDYQNITMAGEVCDMELAVVAPSVNPELAARFKSTLAHDENRFDEKIVEEYESNLEQIAPDGHSAARSLLEQSYYLFDAAVRVADLTHRARGVPDDAPGTVLDAVYIDNLRHFFASRMCKAMSDHGRRILATACRQEVDFDKDFRTPESGPLLPLLLDKKLATIYGWSNPAKPLNHYNHTTTKEDIEYIIDDFSKFAKIILASINR